MVICFQYIIAAFGCEVHVIPVCKDTRTNIWSGLFGRNAGLDWSSFKQYCEFECDAAECAAQLLYHQTNGAYKVSKQDLEKIAHVEVSNGSHIYCVAVDFISAPMLHKKMRKPLDPRLTKDQFAWIPMDELMRRRTVVKLAREHMLQYKFDNTFRRMLKDVWYTKILPELQAGYYKKMPNPWYTNLRTRDAITCRPFKARTLG